MVSQAYNFLTKFLSLSIFFVENAKDNVTDKGSPSGIATTTTVTPIIKKSKISTACSPSNSPSIILSIMNLTNITKIMIRAEIPPNFPISSAITVNFYYKGVSLSSFYCNLASISP